MRVNYKRWRILYVIVAVSMWRWRVEFSDAQINELGSGCSGEYAPNRTEFGRALNSTFSSLRAQLSSGSRAWFATAQAQQNIPDSESVYAMAQCRNYMAQPDCLACYDAAVSSVRRCTNVSDFGARIYFDGCFFRNETYNFYTRTIENDVTCQGRSPADFTTEGQDLLRDLRLATPLTSGYFAAIRRQVATVGGGSTTIYAVAQCTQTVTLDGCQRCLTAGYEDMQGCMQRSETEGRLVDVACYMRYSNRPFFPDNQTMEITRYLQPPQGSRNNDAIIGGVAGGAGLAIILISFILWYKFSRRMKAAMIGNLLGATKLQRPNRFSCEDLEKATNDFSEENKLGQGSFGIVYKAFDLYESGMHHNLADEALTDSDGYSPEELKKVVEIALACTHSTPSSRPSMS